MSDGVSGRRNCTIADAERDGSTECHKLKEAPHPGACLSAGEEEKKKKGVSVSHRVSAGERETEKKEKTAQFLKLRVRTTGRDGRPKVSKSEPEVCTYRSIHGDTWLQTVCKHQPELYRYI